MPRRAASVARSHELSTEPTSDQTVVATPLELEAVAAS